MIDRRGDDQGSRGLDWPNGQHPKDRLTREIRGVYLLKKKLGEGIVWRRRASREAAQRTIKARDDPVSRPELYC